MAAAEKQGSFLSGLSPIPVFPDYTGPYKVGTIDVEIATSELDSPSPAPDGVADIETVQFRIFYPATVESHGKHIPWLPTPQRLHVAAYARFLGLGTATAAILSLVFRPGSRVMPTKLIPPFLSYLPRHLHWTTIPAIKNATLDTAHAPSGNLRLPVVVFSHGLGGNRNAYSHLAGSLASHGTVVVCLEHRDGSAAVTLVRNPHDQGRYLVQYARRIAYRNVPHQLHPEIWQVRHRQTRIRCWEMGLVLEALLGIDAGNDHLLSSNLNASTPHDALRQFAGRLNIQEPGKIIFAGHSFGAATIVQFLKSTYYAHVPEVKAMSEPLFVPREDSRLRLLITEANPTILLDMWCFPLGAASAVALAKLPLPVYADIPSAPGGSALLAVESETFVQWKDLLHATARIISPDPSQTVVSPAAYQRPNSLVKIEEPNLFYVVGSVHLGQSDFGVLFPWFTKVMFGSDNPERVLRLNRRAQLQFLRNNRVPVARTWAGDLIEGAHVSNDGLAIAGTAGDKGIDDGVHEDKLVLDRSAKGSVQFWRWIDIVGLGEDATADEIGYKAKTPKAEEQKPIGKDTEEQREGEIKPPLLSAGASKMVENTINSR